MDGTTQPLPALPAQRVVVARSMLLCLAVLMIIACVALLVRSLDRRFAPLGAGTLLITTLVLALAVDLWRLFAARGDTRLLQSSWISDVSASSILGVLLLSISVPGTPAWAILAAWSVLLVNEAAYYLLTRRIPSRAVPIMQVALSAAEPHSSLATLAGQRPPSLLQSIQRWSEAGEDVIMADYYCAFAAHERQQAIHVVFCPPLAAAPTIAAQRLSGPAMTVKISQCYSYGVRLELRLASDSPAPAMVAVRVHARAAQS